MAIHTYLSRDIYIYIYIYLVTYICPTKFSGVGFCPTKFKLCPTKIKSDRTNVLSSQIFICSPVGASVLKHLIILECPTSGHLTKFFIFLSNAHPLPAPLPPGINIDRCITYSRTEYFHHSILTTYEVDPVFQVSSARIYHSVRKQMKFQAPAQIQTKDKKLLPEHVRQANGINNPWYTKMFLILLQVRCLHIS